MDADVKTEDVTSSSHNESKDKAAKDKADKDARDAVDRAAAEKAAAEKALIDVQKAVVKVEKQKEKTKVLIKVQQVTKNNNADLEKAAKEAAEREEMELNNTPFFSKNMLNCFYVSRIKQHTSTKFLS
jgi:hypothetical protein